MSHKLPVLSTYVMSQQRTISSPLIASKTKKTLNTLRTVHSTYAHLLRTQLDQSVFAFSSIDFALPLHYLAHPSMQPSLPRIFARSQQIHQRCFYKTVARKRSGRPPRDFPRKDTISEYNAEPYLPFPTTPSRDSRLVYTPHKSMSDLQWWAKPAPAMAAPSNQQPSSNGFTIPGLGNAANVPYAPNSTTPLTEQSSAGNQPTVPKGPRKASVFRPPRLFAVHCSPPMLSQRLTFSLSQQSRGAAQP